jgi:hypothetical protein
MAQKDPRVDAYIAKSADFAKPILMHLRKVVHGACPDVVEGMKWSMPHFDYKGIFCGMAAFKQHCTFGFWKGSLLKLKPAEEKAMGQFGCIRSIDDLPSAKALGGIIKQAAKLNDEGVRVPKPKRAPKPPVKTPASLKAALAKNKKASATYDTFAPSCKREYVEWITEAKTDETRAKRVASAVAWMAEGKKRNWKYENC